MKFRVGFVFVLFAVGLVFAYIQTIPNPGHGGDRIFIVVNGEELELQDAIDAGKFGVNYNGTGSYSGSIDFGVVGEDIFVRVSGVDKSFQEAINDGSLCSSSGGGSGSYSGGDYVGHLGDDILIDFNGERSLQDAINAGEFEYDVWDGPSSDNYCGNETFVQFRCNESRVVVGTGTMDRCKVFTYYAQACLPWGGQPRILQAAYYAKHAGATDFCLRKAGHSGAESYTTHGSQGTYTYNTGIYCSSGCEINWAGAWTGNSDQNCDGHSENPYASVTCYDYV